jgi:hypothetical protein
MYGAECRTFIILRGAECRTFVILRDAECRIFSQLYCVVQSAGHSLNYTAWRRVPGSLSIILCGAVRTVSQLYSVAQSVGQSLNYTDITNA